MPSLLGSVLGGSWLGNLEGSLRGTKMIRTGFRAPLYYNYKKEPQKIVYKTHYTKNYKREPQKIVYSAPILGFRATV